MSKFFSTGDSVLNSTGIDFSASLGKAIKFVAGVPAVNDSATVPAIAIVLEGNVAARQSSLGLLGGLSDPVLLQLAGDTAAVAWGDSLMQKNDGTWTKDVGAGTGRCVGAIVSDPNGGVAGGLVAALTFAPHIRA